MTHLNNDNCDPKFLAIFQKVKAHFSTPALIVTHSSSSNSFRITVTNTMTEGYAHAYLSWKGPEISCRLEGSLAVKSPNGRWFQRLTQANRNFTGSAKDYLWLYRTLQRYVSKSYRGQSRL